MGLAAALALPLLRAVERDLVRGVKYVATFNSPSSASDSAGEYGGGLSSSSSSTSIDLYHRAVDGAPSIHCNVRISTSRSFLVGSFHDIAVRTRLLLRLFGDMSDESLARLLSRED